MSDFDNLFDSVFGVTSETETIVVPMRKRANRPSPLRTTEAQEVSGVPITRADWNYVEDGEDTTPVSKRRNKIKSGRAGRRMYNGCKVLNAVGGYSEDIKAIYAPADKEMCVVVDSRRGWNADGTPNRNPAPKYNVSHRGT